MKCKDIERKIIESSERLQDSEQLNAIQLHVKHCSKCSHLKEDVESLRVLLQRRAEPVLPEDLDKRTYQKCQKEIQSLQINTQKVKLGQQIQSIPIHMKVVFISLMVVMGIWIFSFLEDIGSGGGESFSIPIVFGLFLIIQNAMMLLFAPLLIRRFRTKKINIQNTQNAYTVYSIGG